MTKKKLLQISANHRFKPAEIIRDFSAGVKKSRLGFRPAEISRDRK